MNLIRVVDAMLPALSMVFGMVWGAYLMYLYKGGYFYAD